MKKNEKKSIVMWSRELQNIKAFRNPNNFCYNEREKIFRVKNIEKDSTDFKDEIEKHLLES